MDAPVTGVNSRVLKEPLGFIRLIQLPMAILAFATTAGYSATMRIPYSCAKGEQTETPSFEWSYPFDLTEIKLSANFCNLKADGTVVPFAYGAVSQSQFFVCTGVLSFLYGLTILAVYLLSWNSYQSDPRRPMADFAITAILALFWFISSCAWASGLSLVKAVTDPDAIGNQLRQGSSPCKTADLSLRMCTPTQTWNYASLNISLIAGFACCGLWVANLWFIYKESAWYKNRATPKGVGGPGNIPTGSPFGFPTGGQAPGAGGANIRPAGSEFQY